MNELRASREDERNAGGGTIDSRIEACLDRVRGQMRTDPDEAVAREVAGAQARIEQLAKAFVELGSAEDEAIALAIQQVEVGRTALPAVTSALRHEPQSAKQATALALATFGLPLLAVDLGLAEWMRGRVDSHVTYRFAMLAVPLLAGLLVGLAARRRPVRGVANAIAILTVPALMLPGLVSGFNYAFLDFQMSTGAEWAWRAFINATGFPWWLGLGCAGAAVGGRIRRLFVRGGRR